jgi:hypothetical protein
MARIVNHNLSGFPGISKIQRSVVTNNKQTGHAGFTCGKTDLSRSTLNVSVGSGDYRSGSSGYVNASLALTLSSGSQIDVYNDNYSNSGIDNGKTAYEVVEFL